MHLFTLIATQVSIVLFLREAQAVIYQKHNDFSVWGIEFNFPVGVGGVIGVSMTNMRQDVLIHNKNCVKEVITPWYLFADSQLLYKHSMFSNICCYRITVKCLQIFWKNIH